MPHDWSTPGSLSNHSIRALCVWLLLVGQIPLWAGGCDPAQDANDAADVVGSDSVDSGGSGGDPTNGATDDPAPPPADISIDGFWIATRTEDGTTVRGLGSGGQLGDTVSLSISEDDGGSWSFSGSFDGAAVMGTCGPSIADGELDLNDLLSDPEICRGEFSSSGDTLTLTADEIGGSRVWTLERPALPTPSLIGVWDAAASRIACAHNGAVLSVLDPVDTTRRFDAVWSDSGGFVGTDADGRQWTGLIDKGGNELFVWIVDAGAFFAQRSYVRQQEPATFAFPLTGRWMSGYNQGELTNMLRGQASLIFDGSHLYAHQRDDNHRVLFAGDYDRGGYWSIFAAFDGVRFESTAESTSIWSGVVDESGSLIYGHWNDDDTRPFGFVRASTAPTESDLAGTWNSLSSDYQTRSEPTQTVGEAQVSFDGAKLTVQDSSGESDFVIEADWKGDHFEGQWWPANNPADRLRWSGEVVLGGAMIHGKWEFGEWSFTPFALQTRSSLGTADSNTVAIVGDPFEDLAASYRNDSEGIAVAMYRTEGVVSRFSMVGGAGAVEMAVDERLRPIAVDGPDLAATLVWSADSSSVEVTVRQNGAVTVETVQLDLSDQALLAMIDQMETDTGASGDGLRGWVDDNPGRLAAVARGEQSPSSFTDPFAKQVSDKDAGRTKNATAAEVARRLVSDAVAIGGLFWGAVAANSAAAAAASATVVVGYTALALLSFAAVGFIIMYLVFEFIVACFPCSLSCFTNCGLPEEPRRACCIVGGGCLTTTATECSNFGGVSHVSESSCTPNPCQ
jgi:hypothetical protein